MRRKNNIIKRIKIFTKKVEKVVNKIPNNIITEKHKEYIIKYIKIRKQILLDIIKQEGGEVYDK